MTSNIVILTGNHLCNNPRVAKEASTLAKARYNVEVLGAWLDPILKQRDQKLLSSSPFKFVPIVDATESSVSRFGVRLRRKLGSMAHRIGNAENRWELGYCYSALRQAAYRRNAALYIAHSEQAMAVAADLLRDGRSVGLDMEDWYSEDLLPDARRGRPLCLLHSLEKELLAGVTHATCPSRVMRDALTREYGGSPPSVIYNAFPWSDRKSIDGAFKDRKDLNRSSIHWFSQTLGPGRGLEDLIGALRVLEPTAELHLRGKPVANFSSWFLDRVPGSWRNSIFIHGLVSNGELLSRIAEHDIGFAGEMNYCRSRDLTVTNKILHYLLAGLAVVASGTAGQNEVAEQAPEAVFLYPPGDVAALAARLKILINSRERLQRGKAAALKAAEQVFCWERQEQVLLDSITRALSNLS